MEGYELVNLLSNHAKIGRVQAKSALSVAGSIGERYIESFFKAKEVVKNECPCKYAINRIALLGPKRYECLVQDWPLHISILLCDCTPQYRITPMICRCSRCIEWIIESRKYEA